jgi:HSP20 family protein
MFSAAYDPFSHEPFFSLRRDAERLLGDIFGRAPAPIPAVSPRVDLIEKKEAFELRCDIPGVEPEDVRVTFTRGVLSIEAERWEAIEAEGEGTASVRERTLGRFERSIGLTEAIDAGAIEARLRNGVLVVRLPKREEARPRAIPVRVGETRTIEPGALQPKLELPRDETRAA